MYSFMTLPVNFHTFIPMNRYDLPVNVSIVLHVHRYTGSSLYLFSLFLLVGITCTMTFQLVEKSSSINVHRVTDPLKKKSTFNFSQTVGKMVFVSFEVEKMRMFLVQSVVRWCWVLVRSLGAVVSFPV